MSVSTARRAQRATVWHRRPRALYAVHPSSGTTAERRVAERAGGERRATMQRAPLSTTHSTAAMLGPARLLLALAVVRQTLALSSHSPRDLEALPAFVVSLAEHGILNDTVSGLLAQDQELEVRHLSAPLDTCPVAQS